MFLTISERCFKASLVEDVVTDLDPVAREHRHQQIVARLEFGIRIDIDHRQRKSVLRLQRGQRRDHVIAQMTIGPAVNDQPRRFSHSTAHEIRQLLRDAHRQERGVLAAADLQRERATDFSLGQQLVELVDGRELGDGAFVDHRENHVAFL